MNETMDRVNRFLSSKRLAIVGISRNPRDLSVSLFKDLLARGYDAVPVNPAAQEIAGRPCYARIGDVQPPVEAALLFTPPAVTERIVRECADAGIGIIWMYRASGAGAVSDSAVAFCETRGIKVIPGLCPYMFLPKAAFFHRIHRFFAKIPATPSPQKA